VLVLETLQKEILEGKVARGELIDEDARQRRQVIRKMIRPFVTPHLNGPQSFSNFLSTLIVNFFLTFQVV